MKRNMLRIADARRRASLAHPEPWVLLAGAIALTVHLVILLALRRGFDWSDEAWSYSLTANSRITEGEAWGFQHLLHGPFEWLGQSVLAFRMIRFVSYGVLAVVGTVVLARISAVFGFRLRRWEWWLVLVVAQIGTFLAWSFPPRYFAYNEMSALLAQGGALTIAALAARAGGRSLIERASVRAGVWAVAGLVTVSLTITKFTSGAAFCAVLLVVLVVGDGVFGWAKRVLSLLGGMALAGLWLLASGFPIRTFAASIRGLLFDSGARVANGHSPRGLLMMYQQSLGDGIQAVVLPVALFAVLLGLLVAAGGRVSKEASLIRVGALTFGVLAVLSITTLPSIGAFLSSGRLILLMGAMAVVAFVAGHSQTTRESNGIGRRSPVSIPVLVGIAALVGAPFIAAVGTNNAITGQLLWGSTVWCALFGIALVYAARRLELLGSSLATVPVAMLVLFVAISATQVAGDTLIHPFRSTPYFDQAYAVDAPYLQGILLTQDEADWASWLVRESKTLDANDTPTLALASPGALLIFNNSNYASPWLVDFYQVSFGSIGVACGDSRPRSLLVLQPATFGKETASFELFHSALKSHCSVDFPEDFDVVAKHESTNAQYNMEIWRLHD